jgi:hypothetical protein
MRTGGYTWTGHKTNKTLQMKYNPHFGQNTGLQEKIDTIRKLNATLTDYPD